MSCFNTHMEQSIWGIKSGGRVLGSTDSGEEVGEAYARSMTIGAVCNITMGGEGLAGVGKYVGTPVVARDMLEITEREWDRVGKDGSKKGLRYWGFSYGSVLGTTFASMFPDRIERLAVDGRIHAFILDTLKPRKPVQQAEQKNLDVTWTPSLLRKQPNIRESHSHVGL
jgi:hypothetical protein